MDKLGKSSSRNHLYYSILIVLMILIFHAECFKWVENVYESGVHANRSSVALFRWKYSLDGADMNSLKISCGYLKMKDGVTDMVVFIRKKGHTSRMNVIGRLPGNIDNQVEAYEELVPEVPGGVDRSVVGFKIPRAQLNQPIKYRCQGLFKYPGDDLNEVNSEVKILIVLDPPILVNCLQNLPQVKEGGDLEIACSATGNPPPTLQCAILDVYGGVLKKFPDPATTNNITRYLFRTLDRDAESIMCLADGGEYTGHTNITIDLNIRHSPHAPEYVLFIPATNHSCLNIRWSVIPTNETGGEILKYSILYYVTTLGRISSETVVLPVEDLKEIEGFFSHQICGLKPDEKYTVEVAGINIYGAGHYDPIEVVPSSIVMAPPSGDDASVGVIIGGIIAGIVFIVIFVVLAVWCSTHSKKQERLPTSHVEDAVDYPPGIGQSLYASVDKNKNKAPSHAGSATDYPDVVNDTSDVRPMISSNSYETSNKAFV